jgi:hypothetical protein
MAYKVAYEEEEVMRQIVILRDRCGKLFREFEDTSNYPSVVAMARIKARHLAAERCSSSREAPMRSFSSTISK